MSVVTHCHARPIFLYICFFGRISILGMYIFFMYISMFCLCVWVATTRWRSKFEPILSRGISSHLTTGLDPSIQHTSPDAKNKLSCPPFSVLIGNNVSDIVTSKVICFQIGKLCMTPCDTQNKLCLSSGECCAF